MWTEQEIQDLNQELQERSPKEILRLALSKFDNIAVSFSGAEDVVLVDMAVKLRKDVKIFTLDTGRLHGETYRFFEKVRQHYGIEMEVMFPDRDAVERMVREKGMFSFYQDGHKECCGIRKVEPLKRKLKTLDAWVSGQRRDQSPGTRASIAVVESDNNNAGPSNRLTKFNPLANWTSSQVWDYIRMFDVPYNELHERGFVSIGCEPCTRATLPNQHEREGRWWWEDASHKECGLHAGNLKK
jgi:phosphoadenosine phosphosulfate reductase